MPLSLADALAITDEPRIVTSSVSPYSIVHTNRAWSEATGFTFLEVVGKSPSLLQGPGTLGPMLQTLHEALAAGRPSSTVLVNFRKDGAPFRCHLNCEPVTDGSHWVGTLRAEPIVDGSVKALSRSAESLGMRGPLAPVNYAAPDNYEGAKKRVKRSSDKIRLVEMLENTTDPLVLCSATYPHEIMHPNQPWLEMCGYTLEEVEGLTNQVLTGPETDEAAIESLLASVRRKESSVQCLVNYKKDGSRFVNQVRTVPIFDEHDEVAAFASMLREVDEGHIGASAVSAGTEHLWTALRTRLDAGGSDLGCGTAGYARAEAARKLVENHAAVLADMTSSTPSPTQPLVARVPEAVAGYAEQALREVCRRLIVGSAAGGGGGSERGSSVRGYPLEELSSSHPSYQAQQDTWGKVAVYLDSRIQVEAHPSGRSPDMSEAAASAMRQVLRDMASATTKATS